MADLSPGDRHTAAAPRIGSGWPRFLHVHWFRRVGDDPFSSAGLYACRCGVVRPAP
jgi:hypothetical protein